MIEPDTVTWLLVVRHPDYGNEYHTFEGTLPGVRILEIDTGAQFSNGRPSRYWAADCYFNDTDEVPEMPRRVKQALLATYKALASDDKNPKGVDPGTW